jgi:hypothetical protein
MKNILLLIVSIVGVNLTFAQKDGDIDPWKQVPEGFEPFSRGSDGTIEVEVTNQGIDIEDCKNKAKYQAIYKILFFGYNEANNIPKAEPICPTGEALYSEKLDFFNQFFKSSAVNYILDVKPSARKPASKIERKIIRASILVKVDVRNLTKSLENQKIIKSMDDLGFKPSILVVPSDAWLKANGMISSNGTKDYRKATENNQFRAAMVLFENKYADAFELKSITAMEEDIKNEEATNNAKNEDDLDKESPEELLSRVVNADLWIGLDFIIESLDGQNLRSKVTVNMEALDPSTQTKVLVAASSPLEGYSRDLSKLISDGLLAAMNDLRPKIFKYFSQMVEKGIKGGVEVSFAQNAEFNLMTMVTYKEKSVPFGAAMQSFCKKNAEKSSDKNKEPFKVVDSKENKAKYDVYIPFYTVDIDDNREKNSFSSYAEKIRALLDENGYVAVVKPKGMGKCYVRITGKK